MKTTVIATFQLIWLFTSISALGQISGNQVYENSYSRNDYKDYRSSKVIIIKDSIMQVSADILMNMKADSFVITLGLNEEAPSIKECNKLINKRVNDFLQALKGLGLYEKDSYVDFISETKIYTYDIAGNKASQRLKGFEIKKNIIIRANATSIFDKIIDMASDYQIYDIIKVDYINSDMQKIYSEMMQAASKLINQKKDIYLKLSPVTLKSVPKISTETFYAVYPNAQYRTYQAFESSEVSANYTETPIIKSEQRKNKTFYYQKIDQSGFDLVINNATPVVGIQYVLQVQVQFDIIKN